MLANDIELGTPALLIVMDLSVAVSIHKELNFGGSTFDYKPVRSLFGNFPICQWKYGGPIV